jgi:hypothetical protein
MRLTGAQVVWESMVREGVETIFGISGGTVIHLYHALPDYPIHHVLTRHELPTVTPAPLARSGCVWLPRDRARPTLSRGWRQLTWIRRR